VHPSLISVPLRMQLSRQVVSIGMNQGMVGIALTLSSLPPTAQNTSTVIERVERPCRLTQAPESIYCNNFVMAITGCRVTLVVTWPPRSAWSLVVAWPITFATAQRLAPLFG